ncbi:MAG: endonuclease/exonuclease/phosphatase family protein [Myxococcota bacterium]
MQIRLATWNLHTPPFAPRRSQRLRAAAQHLKDGPAVKPDLLLFQEIWSEDFWEELAQGLAPDYAPSLPGAGARIAARSGLASFVRRDSGWRVTGHHFEAFRSEGPLWRFWEGDGIVEKGFEIVKLRRADLPLSLLNTHLQAQYPPRHYSEVRSQQIAQIGAAVAGIPDTRLLLAGGDWNTTPGETLYPALTRFLDDLTATYRKRCGCGTFVGEVEGSEWLDYLFARPSRQWQVRVEAVGRLESEAPDRPFSDHHGVEARLRVEPRLNAGALLPLCAATLRGPSTRRAWSLAAIGGLFALAGKGLGGALGAGPSLSRLRDPRDPWYK